MFKLAALVDEYAYLLAEDYAAAFATGVLQERVAHKPATHRAAALCVYPSTERRWRVA